MTREQGSATIVAIALLGAAVTLALAIGTLAGLVADHAKARAAADLAALAGAYQARQSLIADHAPGEPCAVARRTAAANAAVLTACRAWADGSVQVTVASGRATASARAGPQMKRSGGGSG